MALVLVPVYNEAQPTTAYSYAEVGATAGWRNGGSLPPSTHKRSINMKHTANQLLNKAATLMEQRGQQYDQPEGERSMGKTINAFNAITGHVMTEAEGWLLLALLKMVRDNQRELPHQDSCEDLIAYCALYAEARLGEGE